MLRNLFSDTAFALRIMAARPAFTVVVVLTLAVGIGANIAMFTTIYTSLLQPLPFPEAERLVMGRATFSGRINPMASAPDFFDYRDQSTAFESLSTYCVGRIGFSSRIAAPVGKYRLVSGRRSHGFVARCMVTATHRGVHVH